MIYLAYILCGYLIYQDFKFRKVNLYVMLALFVLNLYLGFSNLNWNVFKLTGFNILLIAILLSLLYAYYSLKNKKLYNITDKELGKGDIIMLFALTPSFISINLMFFIILSISFSILIALIFNLKTIPFAGIIALVFILFSVLKQIHFINFYEPMLSLN